MYKCMKQFEKIKLLLMFPVLLTEQLTIVFSLSKKM